MAILNRYDVADGWYGPKIETNSLGEYINEYELKDALKDFEFPIKFHWQISYCGPIRTLRSCYNLFGTFSYEEYSNGKFKIVDYPMSIVTLLEEDDLGIQYSLEDIERILRTALNKAFKSNIGDWYNVL